MNDFTLSGTIPKLPRRCSPIVVTGGQYAGRHGIIVEDPNGHENVLVCLDDGGYGTTLVILALSDIALDLSDATGRAHATWWLAEYWPEDVDGVFTLLAGRTQLWVHQCAGRRVGVRYGAWATGEWLNWGCGLSEGRNVTSLADLEPTDDRRLPDGSRWVDAVALTRVCIYVAEKVHA